MNGKPSVDPAITAVDAMLVMQHLRAMHPERAEQLNGIAEFIRRQDSHLIAIRRDLLAVQRVADDYKIKYHSSICQTLRRIFSRAKVNPNVG